MRNFACTTQVPNELFDEFLSELSFAELKVLLAVNRATWGWVADKSGNRRERAWIACSLMQAKTGLSKRAITNAVAALIQRRLLCVSDKDGQPLEHAEERRGQTRLYYAIRFPQDIHRGRPTSAFVAEVDQHRMPIEETKYGKNQRTLPLDGTDGFAPRRSGRIADFLPHVLAVPLRKKLQRGTGP